jgi:hypothetical protein
MTRQTKVGQGLLTVEVARSHLHTRHSVGLLWTSDRPDAGTTRKAHKRQTSMLPWRDSNLQSPASERPQTHALEPAATGTDTANSTATLCRMQDGNMAAVRKLFVLVLMTITVELRILIVNRNNSNMFTKLTATCFGTNARRKGPLPDRIHNDRSRASQCTNFFVGVVITATCFGHLK